MFREYQDVRIKSNLKYVKKLSLIALILWFFCTFAYLFGKWYVYDWMISHPQDLSWFYICKFWGGEEFWRDTLDPYITTDLTKEIMWDLLYCEIYFLLAFSTCSFLRNFAQASSVWRMQLQRQSRFESDEKLKERYKESSSNNDVTRIMPYIVFNFVPAAAFVVMIFACLIAAMAGTYENIAEGVESFSYHLGCMFLSHVFLLISNGFLIQSCVLIKREWRKNPPPFLIEEQQKAAEKRQKAEVEIKKQKAEQDAAACKAQLEACGMQFFIEYYSQIKRLPVRDVTVSDQYFPEREVRLTAAKKIFDSGLSEYAIRYIIETYSDILPSEVIDRARSILDETENEKRRNQMKTIKAGEVINARTNAELLNWLLGKHFKAFMKAYRFLDTGEMLWMPRLDGVVRSGWRNTMQNGKIVEEYLGGHPYPSEIDVGLKGQRRIVFEKCDKGGYFIFRGIFELEQGSSLTYRILRPIKDEISL